MTLITPGHTDIYGVVQRCSIHSVIRFCTELLCTIRALLFELADFQAVAVSVNKKTSVFHYCDIRCVDCTLVVSVDLDTTDITTSGIKVIRPVSYTHLRAHETS